MGNPVAVGELRLCVGPTPERRPPPRATSDWLRTWETFTDQNQRRNNIRKNTLNNQAADPARRIPSADYLLLTVCATLLTVGVVIGVIGYHLDASGYWTTRPFLSNVVSGVTTGCFGVPVALLLFSRLERKQNERTERLVIARIRIALLESMRQPIKSIESVFVVLAELDTFSKMKSAHECISSAVRKYKSDHETAAEMSRAGGDSRDKASWLIAIACLELDDALTRQKEVLQQCLNELAANIPSRADNDIWWVDLAENWHRLQDDVRSRAIAAGEIWVAEEHASLLDTALTSPASPLEALIAAKEVALPSYIAVIDRAGKESDVNNEKIRTIDAREAIGDEEFKASHAAVGSIVGMIQLLIDDAYALLPRWALRSRTSTRG